MKKEVTAILGWLLLLIALGIYVYGIYFAIWTPLEKKDHSLYIPEALDGMLSTVGTILLTNLGAVFGISVAQPKSGLAQLTLIGGNISKPPDPVTKRELIQFIALILYVIVLFICFFFWAKNAFLPEDKVRPVVPMVAQNGKTLLGVAVAYAALVLSTNKP